MILVIDKVSHKIWAFVSCQPQGFRFLRNMIFVGHGGPEEPCLILTLTSALTRCLSCIGHEKYVMCLKVLHVQSTLNKTLKLIL